MFQVTGRSISIAEVKVGFFARLRAAFNTFRGLCACGGGFIAGRKTIYGNHTVCNRCATSKFHKLGA